MRFNELHSGNELQSSASKFTAVDLTANKAFNPSILKIIIRKVSKLKTKSELYGSKVVESS